MTRLPLTLSSVFILSACGPMDGDPLRPSAEAKSDFLSEFAQRTGVVDDGYLTINNDGTLKFEVLQNNHCIYEFNGSVDVVEMPDSETFSVTYRYSSLNVSLRSCRSGDSSCAKDHSASQDFEARRVEKPKGRTKILPQILAPFALRLLRDALQMARPEAPGFSRLCASPDPVDARQYKLIK